MRSLQSSSTTLQKIKTPSPVFSDTAEQETTRDATATDITFQPQFVKEKSVHITRETTATLDQIFHGSEHEQNEQLLSEGPVSRRFRSRYARDEEVNRPRTTSTDEPVSRRLRFR
eukprot:GFKZ01006120.1.p1 GENE.GFKZ01006120.1~~GFKZ01006120.1.p1  ORF type:complete len:115 (+),score=5.23 GFKZ01006120.1:83-427(+)